MSSIRSHKIRLDPNEEQSTFFRKCVGVSRFAFNHALSQWQEQHKAGLKPNEAKLRRELNAVKRESFPWMLEVPKSVVQQAVKNVGTAYVNFFRRSDYIRRVAPESTLVEMSALAVIFGSTRNRRR